MIIRLADVRECIARTLGEDAEAETPLSDRCARILRGWIPELTEPEALRGQLEQEIYTTLYAALGQHLTVRPVGKPPRRLRSAELEELCDSLMGLAFTAMGVHESARDYLRSYAFRSGSMAALTALYERFGACMDGREREMIGQILRDRREHQA